MAIKYDIYASPVPSESQREPHYHARVVGSDTVDMEELIHRIHRRCTLTKGDLKAAFVELSEEIVNCLCAGDTIHIDEIGYFSLSLSTPSDLSPKNNRHPAIGIKSVNFRPDVLFKKKLENRAEFECATHKSHSASLDIYEIDALLNDYFYEHPTLTRVQFERLCGLTTSTAQRHLRRLVQEGRIQNIHTSQHPLYEPVKGFYGRE